MEYIKALLIDSLIKALILTIVLELLALLIQKEKKFFVYLVCIIMNIATNISMNFIIQGIPSSKYHIIVLGLEIIVVLIEFMIYLVLLKNKKIAFKRALICNLFSYIGGLLIPFIY